MSVKRAKVLNRPFAKGNIQMARKHINRFSTSLVIKEMHKYDEISLYTTQELNFNGKDEWQLGEDMEKLQP